MKRSWIKLYVEILDDPKMGRLPDNLWRRTTELFLMAGETDCDGLLPPVDDIAWRLRISVDDVISSLETLSKVGIVHQCDGGWVVSHFKDRQFSESYERVKRYRNGKSNADGNAVVAENESTSTSTSTSSSPSDSDSLEEEGVGGETIEIPDTPAQAKKHPDIVLYQDVTGRFPGSRDYKVIIETIQYLRELHGDELKPYLVPFWTAWSSRKTKDNKPYPDWSLVWLCEWAMQGTIPKANGHVPQSGETHMDDVIKKVMANRARSK